MTLYLYLSFYILFFIFCRFVFIFLLLSLFFYSCIDIELQSILFCFFHYLLFSAFGLFFILFCYVLNSFCLFTSSYFDILFFFFSFYYKTSIICVALFLFICLFVPQYVLFFKFKKRRILSSV